MRFLAMLVALLSVTYAFAADLGPPPYSVSNRAETPPAIDGDLADPVWQQSAGFGPFVRINPLSMPAEATTAFALWDDTSLYIAFDCRESQMDKLVTNSTQRDQDGLWEDDCVEVFLAPGGPDAPYYHFIVTAAGTIRDERCASQEQLDVAYDASVRAATRRGAQGWTAEVAIPLADLGGAPKLGDEWRANFNREEKPRAENAGWAITSGQFHRPEEFGTTRFGNAEPMFTVRDLDGPFIGVRMATLWVTSRSVAGMNLEKRARTYVAGQQVECRAEAVQLRATEPEDVEIPYQSLREGDCALGLEIVEAGSDRPLMRTPAFPYTVPPLTATLERLRSSAQTTCARLQRLGQGVEGRTDLVGAARTVLERAESGALWAGRQAHRDRPDRNAWEKAYQDALKLRQEHERLAFNAAAYLAQPQAKHLDYALGVESPLTKVLRDEPFTGEITSTATIAAAKNEYEPTQIVIVPFDEPLKDVRVTWTDLKGWQGTMPASCIDVKRVGYVRTRGKTSADVEYVGWWPDPLMPLAPFDVQPNQNQPLWVTVHVPPGQAPGTYTGELTIQPANSDTSRVKLSLEVWDFELPKETHLRTAFHLGEPVLAQWYGYEQLPQEFRRRWYQFLLDHRMSPSTLYSGEPLPRMEDLGWCIERGMNTFNIGYVGEGKTTDEWLAWLKDYCGQLREKGWLKHAYAYGFDEVGPDRYEQVKREYGRIREAVPDLKLGCTVRPNDELDPHMDVWVPLTASLDPRRAAQQQKAGDEMWWYVCIGPQHPYANWFVDYPAIEPRLLFWMTHKYHVAGFLYYYLNLWTSNMNPEGGEGGAPPIEDNPTWVEDVRAGKRWPEIEWNAFTYDHANGDGHLLYPGPDGQPISSIRFECIRDGIEDHEMLGMLDEAVTRLRSLNERLRPPRPTIPFDDVEQPRRNEPASRYDTFLAECVQLSAVRPQVVRDRTHFTHEPRVLESERETIARQLVRVRRVLERER